MPGSTGLFSSTPLCICFSSELGMYCWHLPNFQIQRPYFSHFPQVPQTYSQVNLNLLSNPCASWDKAPVRNAESRDLPQPTKEGSVLNKAPRRCACTLKCGKCCGASFRLG